MSIINKTPQFLCDKYWKNQIKSFPKKTLNSSTVRDHNYISHLNSCCLLSDTPLKNTDSHIIKSVDIDFQRLPKLKEDIVLWRGIAQYYPWQTPYLKNLYKNIESLKKGDVYVNRAYMYGAVGKGTAECYRHGWRCEEGLLIKMNIPKGAQVSLTKFEGITPRYSKWVCLNNEPIENGHLIELQYILPEDKVKKYSLKTKFMNFMNLIRKFNKFSTQIS